MSYSVSKSQQTNIRHQNRTDINVSMHDVKNSVLFLVSDDRAFYKEVLSQHIYLEELVFISTSSLLKKTSVELRELLEPAIAVLIDWSKHSATLIDIARRDRFDGNTPIIALCGQDEVDHIEALVLGADVTISRLFSPIMLNAKLVAYQRSIEEKKQAEQKRLLQSKQKIREKTIPDLATQKGQGTLSVGVLSLDKVARIFYAANEPIRLTSMEFDLMAMLMSHTGVCLKRDQIINTVWGIEYETGTNFLDVHIHAIRRKLRKAGVLSCIYTVRGIGYRFDQPCFLDTAA
ncbi:MAG: DNA-binding response regulator [Rhodothermales bacterium]